MSHLCRISVSLIKKSGRKRHLKKWFRRLWDQKSRKMAWNRNFDRNFPGISNLAFINDIMHHAYDKSPSCAVLLFGHQTSTYNCCLQSNKRIQYKVETATAGGNLASFNLRCVSKSLAYSSRYVWINGSTTMTCEYSCAMASSTTAIARLTRIV
jgi:hypothetical protein